MQGEQMAEMTDEEADYWDEYYTKTHQKYLATAKMVFL
jgi:hypothetical protein